jgi:hypothetical protein
LVADFTIKAFQSWQVRYVAHGITSRYQWSHHRRAVIVCSKQRYLSFIVLVKDHPKLVIHSHIHSSSKDWSFDSRGT